MPPRYEDAAAHVRNVVDAVLGASNPGEAVAKRWDELDVPIKPTTIIAVGKGSVPMARRTAACVGDLLRRTVVVCPPEHADELTRTWHHPSPLEVYSADHPLPTARNLEAAGAIHNAAKRLGEDELALVLITGGGSAQIASPIEGLDLGSLRSIASDLMRSGATIDELNAVRKHLETLKGGRLARFLEPAEVRVLVISDVLGDPLDVISSGPCAPDPTTFADAIEVLKRHGLVEKHPAVMRCLERGVAGELDETPKPSDPAFDRVQHIVLANNTVAVEAAARAIGDLGFAVSRVDHGVRGSASAVGRALAELGSQNGHPFAAVFGGETTVNVGTQSGIGGRNQELALAAGIALAGQQQAVACSFGTDGIDGPTDAAGAWVTGETVERATAMGEDAADALRRHDSYRFFQRVGGHLVLGPTGTNVNDVWFLLAYGENRP